MAMEEEAAIGFSPNVTRKGLLPLAGRVTRTAEGDDRCEAMPGAGVTLREAGLIGAAITGLSASSEDAGLGLAGRDSSVGGVGGFAPSVGKESGGGVEVREVVSSERFGSRGDVASAASRDFCVSGRRFPSEPRSQVSPTMKPVTTNRITKANAATWNPEISRTYRRDGKPSTGNAGESKVGV